MATTTKTVFWPGVFGDETIAPVEYDKHGRMKSHPVLHPNQGKRWSKDDLQYLQRWYGLISPEQVALSLGRTAMSVGQKATELRKHGTMKIAKGNRHMGTCIE